MTARPWLGPALWATLACAGGAALADGGSWDAVGRLDVGGDVFCTATLISDRTVLTAAHCLFDPATGAPIPVETMLFRAGWKDGRADAWRQVAGAAIHPGFDMTRGEPAHRVPHDVAVLSLQHPVPGDRIAPLSFGPRPSRDEPVAVVSFAHDRAEAPDLEDGCTLLGDQDATLILSCTVDFGASGAPVLRRKADGAPEVVSVISAMARADGSPVSLGGAFGSEIGALAAALSGGTGALSDVAQTAATR